MTLTDRCNDLLHVLMFTYKRAFTMLNTVNIKAFFIQRGGLRLKYSVLILGHRLDEWATFSDKRKTMKDSIHCNHRPHSALVLFVFYFRLLFSSQLTDFLLHFHFWHLLNTRVKSARGKTSKDGRDCVFQNKVPPAPKKAIT